MCECRCRFVIPSCVKGVQDDRRGCRLPASHRKLALQAGCHGIRFFHYACGLIILRIFSDFYSIAAWFGPINQDIQFYLDGNKSWLSDESNYKQSIKSVVYITAEDDEDIWLGSGSIISSDGLVITNSHVIEDSHKVVVTTYEGRHYEVESVPAYDDLLDIAFLKISADGLDPLPIGNSDEVSVGQKTLVIGHAEGFLNTLSIGNVSAVRNYDSTEEGENIPRLRKGPSCWPSSKA